MKNIFKNNKQGSVSSDEVKYQAQMGVAPMQMGVVSTQNESMPMVPQNGYQPKQPVHDSLDQAAQIPFGPAPQYISRPQSPLSNAAGQQRPQFSQHQKQLLPQQVQIQAQMAKSQLQQRNQPVPPLPTQFQTACPLQSLNEGPAPADCPGCGARELTRTEYDVGDSTHGWALACCCFTLLCCIPYMMSVFKDVDHYCGHCGLYLARWHRSGRTVVKVY